MTPKQYRDVLAPHFFSIVSSAVVAISRNLGEHAQVILDEESLYQTGIAALWEALPKWDPEKSQSSYLYMRVYGALVDELRSVSSRRRKDEAIYGTELETSWPEFEESVQPESETALLIADLNRVMTKLSPREQLLFRLYIWEDMNLKEIGAVLKVNESRACQLKQRAISKLRDLLCQ